MANNTAEKPAEESTSTAVTQVGTNPNAVATIGDLDVSMLADDAGSGSQNVEATDMATPIISILQSNSPQCKKSDGKYIEEAEEGMLYNNVTNEVYDGEEGITVIPCYFEKVFIEWKPNRGGLVAIHSADTPLRDQIKMVPNADGKEVATLPNGNNLTETNQHYVLLVKDDGNWEPAVIAMASSALKASRTLNTLVKRVMVQGPKGPFNPASYFMKYKLTTVAKTKDNNSWFTWAIESAGPVTKALYDAGKAFEKAVAAGGVRVKQEELPEAAGGAPAANKDDEIPY